MNTKTNALTPDQKAKLAAEMSARGVKFLPGQVARRVVDPSAASLPALGASKRAKARRVALRATRAAAPVAVSVPAGTKPAAPAKK